MSVTVQRHRETAEIQASDILKAPAMQTERESNTHRAYRELRGRILAGELPPGAQYLEQELAEMLGMSRTPVREALIRLADERLVEVRPRHGARILPLSAEDFREIHEMWAELESLAVRRLAALGPTAAQMAALEEALEGMAAACRSGDRVRWFASKRAFHDMIVTACGSVRLMHTVQGLIDQSECARQSTMERYVIAEQSTRDHLGIVEALREHDGELAAQLVRRHRITIGTAMAALLASPANS